MDVNAQLALELGFCVVPGCDGQTGLSGTARGLCSSHYHKWHRYGDALHEKPQIKHKKVDLAYAAGFIDADGCILLESSRDKRNITPGRFVPKVNATNVARQPIEMLHEMFGGTFYLHKRSPEGRARNNFKQQWHQFVWAVSGDRAVEVARVIEPYLRRKSEQARLLCEMKDESSWSKGGNAAGKLRPEDEIERRWTYVHAIRRLNQNVAGGIRVEEESSPDLPQNSGVISNRRTMYTQKPSRFP